MATAKGNVLFKKKEGLLQLLRDNVTWTPASPPNAVPSLTIPVAQISNLQATPATNPKAMIRIFVQKEADGSTESHVFTFPPTASARTELDAMKEALTTAIQSRRTTSGAGTPSQGVSGAAGRGSGTMPSADAWSRAQLETDMQLQQSLLKSDPELSKTFAEAVLSGSVTAAQFWSTRIHLLRAHGIEKAQTRGPYNVLAAIKSTTVDNVSRLSLSRDQIIDIFNQHPLVKTVYDENVPKVPEDQFWSRFFLSKLFKKLKGEKILSTDPPDNIFDRYLNREQEENERKRKHVDNIPLTIDLEGNEQNVYEKRGNKPDITMRPTKVENVPIIRTLNSLSQKLVDLVAPADDRHSASSTQDERYMRELMLPDLCGDPEEERILLKIQGQRSFFSSSDPKTHNEFETLDPSTVLSSINENIGSSYIDLDSSLSIYTKEGAHSLSGATQQVISAAHNRRAQLLSSNSTTSPKTGGLPRSVFESVALVHATTNEFLHHFWLAFLSGDEKRANDINKLAGSLKNSKERIEAISVKAEEERDAERLQKKRELQEEYKKTGVKPKRRAGEVGGGRKVVEEMLASTITAVNSALEKYQSALAEAEKALAAGSH